MCIGKRSIHLFLYCLLLYSFCLFSPPPGLTKTLRPPVWAGTFYPAQAEELQTQLTRLCSQAVEASVPLPEHAPLRALVLPHAGYIYSGITAGHAARVLKKNQFNKVILIGPDHNIGFRGGAISNVSAYNTPLGTIPLHKDAGKLLKQNNLFHSSTISDKKEHSLEVILPFLQHLIGKFSLVPIVLGPGKTREIAEAIRPLIDARTLLVISSDLSHHLPYKEAQAKDQYTTQGILNLDATVLAEENAACGQYPVLLLMHLARELNWQPVLLHTSNSGDTAGTKDKVVGYSAIAFFEKKQPHTTMTKESTSLSAQQGQTLLKLARQSIAQSLGQPPEKDQKLALQKALEEDFFSQHRGTFVTLTKQGRLRGCIGSLSPTRSLAMDVRYNAINSSHKDPRFIPLQKHELQDIAIEVSILTTPVALLYEDAAELLRKIRPYIDGVILRYGRYSSTYLPQVWKQLPNPEEFLCKLCIKAGLPPNAWREKKLEVKTYQVQNFNE